MRFSARFTALAAAALLAAGPASAQSVSGNLTVDNLFTAYLSTSATTLGSSLVSGADWSATYGFGAVLTPGTNYWLQVVATDQGPPGAFIGDFALTGAFHFANGLQTLVTNTTDWTVQTGSFAGPTSAFTDWGANGVGPWGAHAVIDASAHWIWDSPSCGSCTLYFSTPIIAQAVPSTVPEPSTWALLAGGLAGLGAVVRRRRAT